MAERDGMSERNLRDGDEDGLIEQVNLTEAGLSFHARTGQALDDLAKIVEPEKLVPTTVEFVDIAGLVAGASQGEGLGNKFLSHIRETDAISHVVRCFEDTDIVHVSGKVNPISDIEIIDTEGDDVNSRFHVRPCMSTKAAIAFDSAVSLESRPATTPSLSGTGLFRLTFHLPNSSAMGISMPTMFWTMRLT